MFSIFEKIKALFQGLKRHPTQPEKVPAEESAAALSHIEEAPLLEEAPAPPPEPVPAEFVPAKQVNAELDPAPPAHKAETQPPEPPKKSLGSFYTGSSYSKSSDKDFRAVLSDLGSLGELQLCNELDKLPMEKYILTNLYLPTASGKTSEIDVCCITMYGLFVIEYKNYSGHIYGQEKYKNWLYYSNSGAAEPLKFYNPILQNKSHIKALQFNFPKLKPEVFHSLIVFSNRSDLKCSKCSVPVIHRSEILETVKLFAKTPVLDQQEVDTLYQELLRYCKAPEEIKQAHKDFVSQFQE